MENQESKPKLKKKKHRFLKLILLIIIICIVKILANKFTELEMNKVIEQYPFQFSNTDTLYYITDNFTVPTYYEYNGKAYTVKWKSSSEALQINDNGKIVVNRPKNSSKTVILTEIYKKFIIGKATKTYELTIIPTEALNPDDINVITREDLENKTYNKEMTAYLDNNGNITSMYGNFGKTEIQSAEDAKAVVIAYAKEFGIENVEFNLYQYNVANNFGNYTFDIIVNDVEIESETIQLTTNNKKLIKITNNVDINKINKIDIDSIKNINADDIIKQYLTNNGIDEDYIITSERTTYYKNILCKIYDLYIENKGIYTIYINNENVIDFKSTEKDFNTKKESVECTGTTEENKKIKFDASKGGFLTDKYSLLDLNRNITAVDNKSFWLCAKAVSHSKDDNKIISELSSTAALLLIGELYISPHVNLDITSDTTDFDNPVAVQAYKNIQDAYDWYVDTFDRYSYDNNGAEIKLLIDADNQTDNAAWSNPLKVFMINPAKNVKYSVGKDLEVLGHEYTHAVFTDYLVNEDNECDEVAGANEAYADVFGCLIANKKDWCLGPNYSLVYDKDIVVRDLKNYNTDLTNYSGDRYYAEKYKDQYWTGEEHNISVLISHIGYEMHASKLFSDNDVANIWYKSLTFGLNGNTTFLDIRRNLIQATDQLGFDKLHQDFIAYQFDLEEIYDENYEITSSEDMILDKAPTTTDEGVLKTESDAVEGDWMLDDTTSRTYLVFMSPIGIALNGEPFVVYEMGKGVSKEELNNRTLKLNEVANSENSILKEITLSSNINAQYHIVNPVAMKLIKKVCQRGDEYLDQTISKQLEIMDNTTEENQELMQIIKKLTKLGFWWEVVDSTPYDLYSDLGFI